MKKKLGIIGVTAATAIAATLFTRAPQDARGEKYAAEVDASGIVQRVIVVKADWNGAKCKTHLKTKNSVLVTDVLPGVGWKYDGKNFAPILTVDGKDTLKK